MLTDKQAEIAAKSLAKRLDYPWEHMQPQGREDMRQMARDAFSAATAPLLAKIAELEAKLAQQQDAEPYCYTYLENGEEYFAPPTAYVPKDAIALYTHPAPKVQSLTLDDLAKALTAARLDPDNQADELSVARATEAACAAKWGVTLEGGEG